MERLLGEWIAGPARRPFFWFVNLAEAHAPYLPPLPCNPISAWGRIRASQEWGRHLRGDNWRTVFGGADIPPDALARMRRHYAAAVRNDPLELSPVTIGPAVEQRYGDEVATLRQPCAKHQKMSPYRR